MTFRRKVILCQSPAVAVSFWHMGLCLPIYTLFVFSALVTAIHAVERTVPAETAEGLFGMTATDSANGFFRSESGNAKFSEGSPVPNVSEVRSLEWPRSEDLRNVDFLKLVDEKTSPSEPDISKPGADFGDYPNSAYTLPKGRAYLEFAPMSYQGPDRHNSASNSTAYLLRYGITDDVEFRLTGSGLTSVFDPRTTVTGFAPLIVDTKIHLWDDKIENLIPAASFEAFIQTNLASPEFQAGFQPSVNLNLDFPFTKNTNVEMTFGYTGVQDAVRVIGGERFIPRLGHNIPTLTKANVNVNVFSYQ